MGERSVPCGVFGDRHEYWINGRFHHHSAADEETSLPVADAVADGNADTITDANSDATSDANAITVATSDANAVTDATSDADTVGNTHAVTDADRHDARADARLFRGSAGARVVERDVTLAHLGGRRRATVVER